MIYPLFNKIVVQRCEEDKETPGGIILPDNARGKSQRGSVVARGPGRRRDDGGIDKPAVEVGNEVIFTQYSGTEVEVGGEDLLILSDDDILAIVG